MSPLSRSPTLC